jgi:hypothetical protein
MNTPIAKRGPVAGFNLGKSIMLGLAEDKPYRPSSIRDAEFKTELKSKGVSLKETPGTFLGAYTARVLGDVVADETRKDIYWRFNHPLAVADVTLQKAIDPQNKLGPYGRGAIGLAALQPAIALTGAYNPLNISELGRPTGYKQNVPNPEEPTETLEPGTEIFQRFFQGRTGRPLAYEKAQEEIPDLTKTRYANYMNFLYNDPGALGKATMGMVKVTGENLEGDPEARIFGYPVSIPSVTAAAGGIAGARAVVKMGPLVESGRRTPAVMRGLAGGALGSAAGAVAGVLMNQAVSAAGNAMNKLPTQQEYQNISAGRI